MSTKAFLKRLVSPLDYSEILAEENEVLYALRNAAARIDGHVFRALRSICGLFLGKERAEKRQFWELWPRD